MDTHAARLGDAHHCPRCNGGALKEEGWRTVQIGNEVAARKGDRAECDGDHDAVVEGCETVQIGGRPAARKGDKTERGGAITCGLETVWIGAASVIAEAARVTGTCETSTREELPEALRKRLASMPATSGGNCASGARKILGDLYGKKFDWKEGDTRDGTHFKAILDRVGGYEPIDEPADGRFVTGDVRVLHGSAAHPSGHVEVYIDGTWYSDFVQTRTSLHSVDPHGRYTSSQLYRHDPSG